MFKKIRRTSSGNPDVTLLQGLKEGDRAAYSRLLGKYYDMVFLIVSALDDTGSDDEIKETTAEILIEIWDKRAMLPGDRPLKEPLFEMIYKRFQANGGRL